MEYKKLTVKRKYVLYRRVPVIKKSSINKINRNSERINSSSKKKLSTGIKIDSIKKPVKTMQV